MTRFRLLLGALVVIVLALGAANLWLVPSSAGEDDPDPVAATEAAVTAALSYDHRALDEGLDAAVGLMTDDFGAEFQDTFDRTVRPTATEQRAVTRAVVREAGLVSRSDDTARVLLYVDQVTGGEVTGNRVLAEVDLVDGAWLLSGLGPL